MGLAEAAGITHEAKHIITKSLIPIVDQVLSEHHRTSDWFDAENLRREAENKKPNNGTRSILERPNGWVIWGFNELLRTAGGDLWQKFKPHISERRAGISASEIYEDFIELAKLRNFSAHDEERLEPISAQDCDRFVELGVRIARAVGDQSAATQLIKLRIKSLQMLSGAVVAPGLVYREPTYPHAREISQLKRLSRGALANAGLHYYRTVNEQNELPLVAKSAWIPKTPEPLAGIDRTLLWLGQEAQDVPPLRLPLFDGHTCSEWSRAMNPSIELDEGSSYRLMEIDAPPGKLSLMFQPTDYVSYYDTCEALGYELAEWCFKNPGQLPDKTKNDLPHHGTPDRIFDLTNRNAVPGQNALVILLNDGSAGRFLLHDRYHSVVAEAQHTRHVVPAGTFQPSSYADTYHQRDFSLRRAILREFSEELLGQREVEHHAREGEDFLEDKKMQRIVALERSRRLRIFFLGLGFDPVTTKPEFLLAIVLDESELGRMYFDDNDEGKHFSVPLSEDALRHYARDPKMLPAGSACLTLAAMHYNILTNSLGRDYTTP